MKTETRNNGITDYDVLVADEGKVLRRKGTEEVFGKEFALGFSHYIGGFKLAEPHEDKAEDFEEIDAPPEELESYDI